MAYNVPLSSINASDGNVTYAQGTILTVGAGGNVTVAPSLFVNTTGNVGIGTATVGAPLQVRGNILISNTAIVVKSGQVRATGGTLATAGSASGAGAGTITYVTDATATTPRSIAAGGGANKVMVWSDGTNWLIF